MAKTPKTALLLAVVTKMYRGGGGVNIICHVLIRGNVRVCCDPLIDARSGSVSVANAWKFMFDVPEVSIAVWE